MMLLWSRAQLHLRPLYHLLSTAMTTTASHYHCSINQLWQIWATMINWLSTDHISLDTNLPSEHLVFEMTSKAPHWKLIPRSLNNCWRLTTTSPHNRTLWPNRAPNSKPLLEFHQWFCIVQLQAELRVTQCRPHQWALSRSTSSSTSHSLNWTTGALPEPHCESSTASHCLWPYLMNLSSPFLVESGNRPNHGLSSCRCFVFNTNPTSVLDHPHTRSDRRLHELKLSRSHCHKSSSQEINSLPHLLTRHHSAGSRLLGTSINHYHQPTRVTARPLLSLSFATPVKLRLNLRSNVAWSSSICPCPTFAA